MNHTTSSLDNHMSAQVDTLQLKGLRKKRLLLHCCCAPCASYVIKHLEPEYDMTLFFYNPNIEPYEEYARRYKELERLEVMYSLHYKTKFGILKSNYDNAVFAEAVSNYKDEPEGGMRCKLCFDIRLGETARQARAYGFDIFGTTLSVSPHKNAAILTDSGFTQSAEHNISYLSADFKKENGYMQSVELSKRYGLYRQNYCGCLHSKRQTASKSPPHCPTTP